MEWCSLIVRCWFTVDIIRLTRQITFLYKKEKINRLLSIWLIKHAIYSRRISTWIPFHTLLHFPSVFRITCSKHPNNYYYFIFEPLNLRFAHLNNFLASQWMRVQQYGLMFNTVYQERFANTKGVFRNRKSKIYRKYNDQKKRGQWSTTHYQWILKI